MLNLWGDPIPRKARLDDRERISRFLASKPFSQRHLGWDTPLSWLGMEPFFLLESGQEIVAALACPPDEDGICWLRIFASQNGYPRDVAWKKLWPEAQAWIDENHPEMAVTSLLITLAGFNS